MMILLLALVAANPISSIKNGNSASQNRKLEMVAIDGASDGGSGVQSWRLLKRCCSSTTAVVRTKVVLYYNDVYEVILPKTHGFPMSKYRLVREGLQREVMGISDGVSVEYIVSPMATREELETTHCPEYIERFLTGNLNPKENRKIGFPWSTAGVQRSTSSVGGTVAAMRTVCGSSDTVACHLAGGTHHAFRDYGEGFCVFSDIAVAANLALLEYPEIRKIVIIDLDVHQGNGNAVLFQNDPRVTTFSMHCIQNYFSQKQNSDIDIELEAGMGDQEYLGKLQSWLPYITTTLKPDLIFFQAGVDPHKDDRLGRLKLTRTGLSKRNRMVFNAARRAGARIVVTMGGGYPRDSDPDSEPFRELIGAHMDVYQDCVGHAKITAKLDDP